MNLNEVRNGQQCRITWLMGDSGNYLKNHFNFKEDDTLQVVQNLRGNMLISHAGKKLAMDKNVANAIKVEHVA